MNDEIARLAAQQANKLYGQWMPERWLNLFLDSYADIEACREAEPIEAIRKLVSLFDDEGNLTATFEQLQEAVLNGFDVLSHASTLSSHHQNTGE